jgi:hypothetical protein
MIRRETRKVTGIAAADASRGAKRLEVRSRSTITSTVAVVITKLVTLVRGNSRNFRQVGRVR